jgi:hypothetical protein
MKVHLTISTLCADDGFEVLILEMPAVPAPIDYINIPVLDVPASWANLIGTQEMSDEEEGYWKRDLANINGKVPGTVLRVQVEADGMVDWEKDPETGEWHVTIGVIPDCWCSLLAGRQPA